MTLLTRDEIITLVKEIVNCSDKSEEDVDKLVEQLTNGVLDPQIINYVFWSEMRPEEIADKALAYKPICL